MPILNQIHERSSGVLCLHERDASLAVIFWIQLHCVQYWHFLRTAEICRWNIETKNINEEHFGSRWLFSSWNKTHKFVFPLPGSLNFVVKLKFETENWINFDVNLGLKGMAGFVSRVRSFWKKEEAFYNILFDFQTSIWKQSFFSYVKYCNRRP